MRTIAGAAYWSADVADKVDYGRSEIGASRGLAGSY